MCKSLVGKANHKGWKNTASTHACKMTFLNKKIVSKKVFGYWSILFYWKDTVREACIRSLLNNEKLTIKNWNSP